MTRHLLRRLPVVAGLSVLVCSSVSEQPASAATTQACNLTGTWHIDHVYMRYRRVDAKAVMQVTDRNGKLSGSGREGVHSGQIIDGRLRGRNVSFDIQWSNGFRGRYQGIVMDNGRLTGTNFDVSNPGERQTWFVDTPFANCVVRR